MQADVKAAEDTQLKIDLAYARQKLLDMADAQTNHQAINPYCAYISDTFEYFNRMSEKSNKFLTSMIPFLNEIHGVEKNIIKLHKEFNLSERRKKEN